VSKIRIGIIGAGGRGIFSFGHMLTRQFKDRATVVAFADPNRSRAEGRVVKISEVLDVKSSLLKE